MLVFRCLGPAGSKASADTIMTWKYINPLLVLITSYMYLQKKFQTEYDINVFSGFVRHIAGYIFKIHGKIGIMNINFVYFKRIETFKWSWMSPTTCIYKTTKLLNHNSPKHENDPKCIYTIYIFLITVIFIFLDAQWLVLPLVLSIMKLGFGACCLTHCP